MAYNINKLNDKYAVLTGEKKAGGFKKGPGFTQWKPTLKEDGSPRTYNVRFLPYQDQNEQPFQEVNYIDNKAMSSFRLVSAAQFEMADPISEFVIELRKQRNNKEAWQVIKQLLPKPRYYAPVLVREELEKGVQVWEFSSTVCKEIYSYLVSEDYREEDVTNPLSGRDFQVSVSPSGKIFKAPGGKEYPVNDIKVMPRMKQSKIASDQEKIDAIIKSIPNLLEIFKNQVKPEEELKQMLEKFLEIEAGSSQPVQASENAEVESAGEDKVLQSIDAQFSDL